MAKAVLHVDDDERWFGFQLHHFEGTLQRCYSGIGDDKTHGVTDHACYRSKWTGLNTLLD